jgi:hypothetical protein
MHSCFMCICMAHACHTYRAPSAYMNHPCCLLSHANPSSCMHAISSCNACKSSLASSRSCRDCIIAHAFRSSPRAMPATLDAIYHLVRCGHNGLPQTVLRCHC